MSDIEIDQSGVKGERETGNTSGGKWRMGIGILYDKLNHKQLQTIACGESSKKKKVNTEKQQTRAINCGTITQR